MCMRDSSYVFTYLDPSGLPLVLVEEVERFDTEHPGNANDSNNHKNHMNVALEWRENPLICTCTCSNY